MVKSLLMPESETVPVQDGVALGLDRWVGEGAAASRSVLFLHATGFTRGVWRAHCRALLGDCTPFAVDLRGHGASSRPEAPYLWPTLVDDIVALVEREGWTDLLMCGHSVGGSTAVEVAVRLPDRVSALVLTEAPLNPPNAARERPGGGTGRTDGGSPDGRSRDGGAPSDLVAITEKRRPRWPSRDEAAAYLRQRSPYDSWDDAVYAGWTETGFTATDDGVELSCPPWVEASVFREAHGSQAWDRLPDLRCPTWVMRATGDRGMPSTTSVETAARIPGAREIVVDGSGHFLPLERPGLVVDVVRRALDATPRPAS